MLGIFRTLEMVVGRVGGLLSPLVVVVFVAEAAVGLVRLEVLEGVDLTKGRFERTFVLLRNAWLSSPVAGVWVEGLFSMMQCTICGQVSIFPRSVATTHTRGNHAYLVYEPGGREESVDTIYMQPRLQGLMPNSSAESACTSSCFA